MGLNPRQYFFTCPRGHSWVKNTYGGLFNWTRCQRCGDLGVPSGRSWPAR